MTLLLSTDAPGSFSINPPGFAIVTAVSIAGTVIAATALLGKYGPTRVVAAIPAHTFELGLILGGLITFNLTFFLGNILCCDCSAWAGG